LEISRLSSRPQKSGRAVSAASSAILFSFPATSKAVRGFSDFGFQEFQFFLDGFHYFSIPEISGKINLGFSFSLSFFKSR